MLDPLPQSQWSRRSADHLLSRVAFGGSPDEREQVYRLGLGAGVETVVDALVDPVEEWSHFPIPEWVLNEEGSREFDFFEGVIWMNSWYFIQMSYAQPVAAKMFKFFVDHFPVDFSTIEEGVGFVFLFKYFDLLRSYSMGDFKELVENVSWSGAMVSMLDLYESDVGEVNENFARELMELFTLGVDGGYTEQDVAAAAAAFTGRKFGEDWPHDPVQIVELQDQSEKQLLGATIVSGQDAIDVIFDNIQCAYHTCWKIWRYFVAPDPQEELLQTLADRFKNLHGYQIRPLLKDIFLSEGFYNSDGVGKQISDPVDYLISSSKALESEHLPSLTALFAMGQMGQDIMFPPSIAGWPEPVGEGNEWLSTSAMLHRLNMPSIWSHKNISIFDHGYLIEEFGEVKELPEIQMDRIAPRQLRTRENFNLWVYSRICGWVTSLTRGNRVGEHKEKSGRCPESRSSTAGGAGRCFLCIWD